MPSEQEINIIRGKIISHAATDDDLFVFLNYVSLLENLVEKASMQDFYGTEGWQHYIGWE